MHARRPIPSASAYATGGAANVADTGTVRSGNGPNTVLKTQTRRGAARTPTNVAPATVNVPGFFSTSTAVILAAGMHTISSEPIARTVSWAGTPTAPHRIKITVTPD